MIKVDFWTWSGPLKVADSPREQASPNSSICAIQHSRDAFYSLLYLKEKFSHDKSRLLDVVRTPESRGLAQRTGQSKQQHLCHPVPQGCPL